MDELLNQFNNITINEDQLILLNIKKYLDIIHCNEKFNDNEVEEVHEFWRNLNKQKKQNLLDFIYDNINNENNMIQNYLQYDFQKYKSNIYLFTYYLINLLY
jgi:predicted metal-binding protein